MKNTLKSRMLVAALAAVVCCAPAGAALAATTSSDSSKDVSATAESTEKTAETEAADAEAAESDADDAEAATLDKAAMLAAAAMTDLDETCTACHTTQACAEVTHTGISCTFCHDSTDETFISRHEGKTADDRMPKKLKKTTVEPEKCLACHAEDYTEEAVGDNILVDSNGTEVNPHAIPSNETHDAKITCLSCHTVHEDAEPLTTATKFCTDCHHAKVFECNTCHEA